MTPELAQNTSEQVSFPLGMAVQRRSNEATRFGPGTSGNPGGRPRTAMFRRKAIRHLKAEIAAGVDQLDAVIDGQIQQAIEKRDTVAATFLRDTVDGKPASNDPQAISQTLFYSPAFVAVTLPELEEET